MGAEQGFRAVCPSLAPTGRQKSSQHSPSKPQGRCSGLAATEAASGLQQGSIYGHSSGDRHSSTVWHSSGSGHCSSERHSSTVWHCGNRGHSRAASTAATAGTAEWPAEQLRAAEQQCEAQEHILWITLCFSRLRCASLRCGDRGSRSAPLLRSACAEVPPGLCLAEPKESQKNSTAA